MPILKLNYKFKLLLLTSGLLLVLVSMFSFWQLFAFSASNQVIPEWNNSSKNAKKKYIKWFEFKATYEVLDKTSKLDIASHTKNENVKLNWIELISYLACKYGNDFSRFKSKDLDSLVAKLREGQTMETITKNMKNYAYYFEGYDSVLHAFIGEYKLENKNTKQFEEKYSIKAFSPVAKGYSYSHYDDFGNSRSYGYKRLHFGNDLMGSIGTPVIAVESGTVEAVRLESVWGLENWNS